jgi:carbonic anhydrase/acetyltransferase-like protein (isoleucine patch superfamily)
MPIMRRHPGGWIIADSAHVSGDVRIGQKVSIWFNASIRGDVAPITIGRGTNIQDSVVVHCDAGVPNEIGENVTIGHAAVVHGCRVGNGSLIGMSATLLGGSEIGEKCLVAAGAVVPPGMKVPDGTLVAGVPAKIMRQVKEKDLNYLRKLPPHYVHLANQHADGLFEPGGRPLEELT